MSVLGGGFGTRRDADKAVEAGARMGTAEPADFRPVPWHLSTLDAEVAARVARAGVLLDARSGDRDQA